MIRAFQNAQFDCLLQRSEVVRGNNSWGKRPQNFNVSLFTDTIEHKNLKFGTVIVCDEGFPKMLSLMTSHKGQRSKVAIISAKKKAPKL